MTIGTPEPRHLRPLWPKSALTRRPERPDYAASGSAAGTTAFVGPDAPLIITDAEFAASCSDLVERWA